MSNSRYPPGFKKFPWETKQGKWNIAVNIISDEENISTAKADKLLSENYGKYVKKYNFGWNLEHV